MKKDRAVSIPQYTLLTLLGHPSGSEEIFWGEPGTVVWQGTRRQRCSGGIDDYV